MAMDQLEQYRQDALAMGRAADFGNLFAAVYTEKGDEAGAEQARDDVNAANRFAEMFRELAKGDA